VDGIQYLASVAAVRAGTAKEESQKAVARLGFSFGDAQGNVIPGALASLMAIARITLVEMQPLCVRIRREERPVENRPHVIFKRDP
jgi:hypothetical protein